MKKLATLLWLLPLPVAAQVSSTTSLGVGERLNVLPPLLRTYSGDTCRIYPERTFGDVPEGTAKMTFTVGTNGRVTAVTITQSSGTAYMDDLVTRCVKSWEFIPPTKDGQAAEITADTMVTFSRVTDHSGNMTWLTPQMRNAADIASRIILAKAEACMHENTSLPGLLAGRNLVTSIIVFYRSGEVSRVSVALSSGNNAIDKVAVECFMNVPKDEKRADYMRKLTSSVYGIPWKVMVGNAPPAQPAIEQPAPK